VLGCERPHSAVSPLSVHYPLPLKFEENPDATALRNTIGRLRHELDLARNTSEPSVNKVPLIVPGCRLRRCVSQCIFCLFLRRQYKEELLRVTAENRRLKDYLKTKDPSAASVINGDTDADGAAASLLCALFAALLVACQSACSRCAAAVPAAASRVLKPLCTCATEATMASLQNEVKELREQLGRRDRDDEERAKGDTEVNRSLRGLPPSADLLLHRACVCRIWSRCASGYMSCSSARGSCRTSCGR
jgi:hypothetical protein